MRDARPQRHVSARVTDREAKAYRIVIVPDYIANDGFRSRTERSDRVFAVGKTADHQTGKLVEAAAPLKNGLPRQPLGRWSTNSRTARRSTLADGVRGRVSTMITSEGNS